MTEKFAPYDIALKLKKLGFDKPCFGYYLSDSIDVVNQSQWDHMKSQEQVNYIFGSSIKEVTLSPTWDDVIDFIFDKYKIFIEFELTDNTREYYFSYNIVDCLNREYHDEDMIDQAKRTYDFNLKFDTKQEARKHSILTILNTK